MMTQSPGTADDLLAYWGEQAARGVDGVPDDRAFDAFGLRPWLGRVSVYRALPDVADFLLRLEGTEIVAITGEDWTGHRASEIDAHYRGTLRRDLSAVAADRRPLVDEVRIFQKSFIRIKRLLLPVGRDGRVTKVLLCFFPRDEAMAMPFTPRAVRTPPPTAAAGGARTGAVWTGEDGAAGDAAAGSAAAGPGAAESGGASAFGRMGGPGDPAGR